MKNQKTRILFLCTHNSCRSQMAEGWMRRLKTDFIEPYSAGIKPSSVDPLAVRVMEEAGVDISSYRSKHLDELRGIDFDYVITVCDHARQVCPVFPARTNSIHHRFDDPSELARKAGTEQEALAHYRRVRDKIRALVENLYKFL